MPRPLHSAHGSRRARAAAILRRLAGSLPLAWLVACGEEPGEPPGVDLARLLPEAEVWSETGTLDFGTETAAAALLSGWRAPARGPHDYLWGAGELSELEFRRTDGRAFRLRMRGWSHPSAAGGADVDVSIGGVAVGRVHVGPGPTIVALDVPAGVARPGRNRLELAYPAPVAGGRYRQSFGAAWDGVRFEDATAGERPARAAAARRAAGGIEIPAGSGIDFFVELGGRARLTLAGVDEEGARLEADLACAGEPERLGLLAHRSRAVELRRRAAPVAPCRLTLRAAPNDRWKAVGNVHVAAARLHGVPPPPPPPEPAVLPAEPPSFVIYIVDALRRDRLGCYGAARPATPTIDRFAGQAAVFEDARAQSSWTRPAVATLFTGLTPLRHVTQGSENRLPDAVVTLAERLRPRGYATAYVTTNGNTTDTFGFAQGLDFFRWIGAPPPDDKARWPAAHAAAREFLDTVPPGGKYFLVVHTVEPHAPYRPTPAQRLRWAAEADPALGERDLLAGLPHRGIVGGSETAQQVAALYDATVADADEGFADFLAELERRGRLDDTAILFLSDHGEELFDHGGVEHGHALWEELLRIPMIWKVPGARPGRVATTFDQLDVTPTLMELARLPRDPTLHGRSFAAALFGGEAPAPRSSPAWLERLHFHKESVAYRGSKLIRDLNTRSSAGIDAEWVFHLDGGPVEGAEIEGADRDLLGSFLGAKLRGWAVLSGLPLAGETAEIDEHLRQELAALGYLQ